MSNRRLLATSFVMIGSHGLRAGLLIAFFLTAADTGAEAHQLEVKSELSEIKLKWETRDTSLVFSQKDPNPVWHAKIRGRLTEPGYTLSPKQEISAQRDARSGEFSLNVPLTGSKTEAKVHLLNASGKAASLKLTITMAQWRQPVTGNEVPIRPFSWLTLALGPSLIHYTETGVAPFSELALTLKPAVRHEFGHSNWEIGASGYVTALPLWTNQAEISAYFAGLNLRVGYSLPFIRAPWKLTLAGGWYYSTTAVTGGQFGYQNQGGFQLYPVLRRRLTENNAVSVYFKYSPVTANAFFFPLLANSREIAYGAAWEHVLGNRHTGLLPHACPPRYETHSMRRPQVRILLPAPRCRLSSSSIPSPRPRAEPQTH